ncbi:Dicarboxylate carrier MatC domain protein [Thermosinus carboxydivorans Nor1]|uniref:Dicarboxylate carrier MatC domain protein n=1 Tax=Thermosinus carboxydivorans Nor1 TaxID=401526 RepID=A1HRB8_9FIRM|nr:SLC13 family permease [Thermosinus carboxydivorans]EAX47433.1 Dicarboxylate carrier MatC domain protein [Thermosinus carboxydivorans Nor1]
MNLGLLSLIALVLAIAIGFFRKLNTGLIAIAFAFILGKLAGFKEADIINGWSTQLFMMLLGVTFLFSIAQTNGTLELFARKVVAVAGRQTRLIPIAIYLLTTFLAAIGPGTIPVMALIAPISMALAAELGISPLLLAPIGILGACAGGISPIAPTGIIGITLAAKQGITGIDLPYFYNSLMGETLFAAFLYLVLGGYKIKSDKVLKQSDLPAFNRDQLITMAGIVTMVVVVLLTKYNVGLVAFVTGVVLLWLNVADERKSIAGIPWGTLILVCGVGVLMNIAIKLKGIDMLAKFLATFMTPATASPIIGLTAGIMSWFSSTSGVVMPTLIPTVSALINSLGGNVSPLDLISAITMTAHTAGISPASTGGALALASYAANAHISAADQNKLFIQMFLVAVTGVIFMTLVAASGLYRIWGL